MVEETNNIELANLSKEQLIEMVQGLNEKLSKIQEDYQKVINLRLYNLERRMNMNAQYQRRDTLEITGIPADIPQEELEDDVIDLFKDMKVTVNRQPIRKIDIQAVHRIGKKGKVILKVVNRKFAQEALYNGKKLKDNKKYGEGTKLYINESLIPEFGFINFVIRKAQKAKKIYRYKIRNGIHFIQVGVDDDFVEIGHQNDIENLGIEIPKQVGLPE